MSRLLALPRELRDEVYEHLISLPIDRPAILQRPRKRITYSASNPESHYGEEAVRFLTESPTPPAHGLLGASRQLRAEFKDALDRLGGSKYKIDVALRGDKQILYPTWIRVPSIAKRVSVIDVKLRMRERYSTSVCSVPGEGYEMDGNTFCAGLGLLQRFLERGIHFLSKKKAESLTIDLLVIDMNFEPKTEEKQCREVALEIVEWLYQWMVGKEESPREIDEGAEGKEREDRQFRFLASKVERLKMTCLGDVYGDWCLRDMVAERDKYAQEAAAAAAEIAAAEIATEIAAAAVAAARAEA